MYHSRLRAVMSFRVLAFRGRFIWMPEVGRYSTRASIPCGRIVAAPREVLPPISRVREAWQYARTLRPQDAQRFDDGPSRARRRYSGLAAWKRNTGSMAVLCLDNHTAATGDRGSDGDQVRRVGVRRSGAPGGRDRGLTARTRDRLKLGPCCRDFRHPKPNLSLKWPRPSER